MALPKTCSCAANSREAGGGSRLYNSSDYRKRPLPPNPLGTGPQTAATFLPSWNTSEDSVSMEVLRNSGVLSSVRTMGWMMRDA